MKTLEQLGEEILANEVKHGFESVKPTDFINGNLIILKTVYKNVYLYVIFLIFFIFIYKEWNIKCIL